jgi:hypothetical protein
MPTSKDILDIITPSGTTVDSALSVILATFSALTYEDANHMLTLVGLAASCLVAISRVRLNRVRRKYYEKRVYDESE